MASPESDSKIPAYPPKEHIYRDLQVLVERSQDQLVVSFPVVPEVLDTADRPRIGLLATIADIAAGELAIRTLYPQWVATSSLSVQSTELPSQGRIYAQPQVLRRGRTTVVLEVALSHQTEAGARQAIGLSTVSMSVLPERRDAQKNVTWADRPDPQTTFALPGSGFEQPITERLGIEFDPNDSAIAQIRCVPYVLNTLGAIQGGIVSLFIEAAAENYAAQQLGGRAQIQSLEVHYLKLCRGNPIRAAVREIGKTASGLALRVELYDEGQGGVLATVGNVIVEAPRA
ncbi:MAG: hypothetical protein AB8G23_07440 [Myxococcota bacterium]